MNRLVRREFHRFSAGGREFVYLVPSAAVFALDEPSRAVIEVIGERGIGYEELRAALAPRFPIDTLKATVAELQQIRAIAAESTADASGAVAAPLQVFKQKPPTGLPVSTLVLNVTNKCNLACTYCYEYGEDKIVDTENGKKPKFMSEETARQSVELLLKESGRVAHVTFFGGETLLNFPVLQKTIAYARERARELGKELSFNLTTNATLLRPEIIEFLAEEQVGVTISIDGPKEMQDKFRVFHNGAGSYDVVMPKIKDLLRRHRTRPIGARVTLTSQTLDIRKIYQHLTEEIGFWEVGFAPVTTSPGQGYAIGPEGFDGMLAQFRALAGDFRDAAVAGRHHGFSNVKETLEEIHKGVSKAYPCGAGIGLLGVSTDGEVALCHRFAGSDAHGFGNVREGLDRAAQDAFLDAHHLADKTDCSRCWARPLCSGGCYHEAYVRYGDTTAANLHYCDWIRGWTHTCLEVYGEIAERNPAYLSQFETDVEKAEVAV
ncbi:MAG: quinohemoprotein amine dehydrogenase maturation protein [Vicinamibacterales bacterium]